MAKNETYEEFVQKFKSKKTTDDCYTPDTIYDVVKSWVIEEYKLKNVEVVRPFYPSGNYEKFNYPSNCVVIDNPPFSILSKIIKFYNDNKISFFLFSPHLTIFSSYKNNCSYIITNYVIEYENGAKVNTGFTTNLENDAFIRTSPLLKKLIKDASEKIKAKNSRQLTTYKYPKNLITSTKIGEISELDFTISKNQCYFLRSLDEQKKMKKGIFGSGFLICDEKAEEIQNKKNQIQNKKIQNKKNELIVELSQKEKEIILQLNNEKKDEV